MPAEWTTHKACFLAWPYDTITFPNRIERVENAFLEILKVLQTSELVYLLVTSESMKEKVLSLLNKKSIPYKNIVFFIADYSDVWLRDYAPLFVNDSLTNKLVGIKWKYNAYGDKFTDLLKDNEVFLKLQNEIGIPLVEAPLYMEGGALELNGAGTLITTEQCLLNSNRNPTLSRTEIESSLKKYLGVSHIIWLKEGIVNDHTDGHVDDIVRFVNESTIVCAYEDDPTDPNFEILESNYKILEQSVDRNGNAFSLIKLPMPHMNYDTGEKAPASYANFYIGNTVVLVPIFNDPNDNKALEILANVFPTRKVIGIDCSDVIYGGGAIHCVTQQLPLQDN